MHFSFRGHFEFSVLDGGDAMNATQRLKLQEMIEENNVADNTQLIRMFKHSDRIRADVEKMSDLHRDHADDKELYDLCRTNCSFLYNSYTDLFNRLMKHELNTTILNKVLTSLKKIEDGELDQHEASFEVGTLLKTMYVDSAMKRQEKREKQDRQEKKSKKSKKVPRKCTSWSTYKTDVLKIQ